MKNTATLPQAVQILSLFSDKELSVEQGQDVLGSGYITDVLEAAKKGKLDTSHRDDIREILGLERLVPKPTITSHTVTIDYSQSTEEMVLAGRYDSSNKNINSQNFPVRGEGKKQIEVFEIHFGRTMDSSEEVIAEMDKLGYKPAELPELLSFGKEKPELQRDHPIIALGSSAVLGGDRSVPSLGECASKRRLCLYFFDHDWNASCRFLAVRKSSVS